MVFGSGLWVQVFRFRILGLGFTVLRFSVLGSSRESLPIGPKVVPFWDYLIEF